MRGEKFDLISYSYRAMTAVELDPVFVRALRLLHSKSKDSTSQLKSMLDEAIRHRKGLGPGPTGFGPSSPQQRKRDRDGNGVPRKDADKRYCWNFHCVSE